MEVEVFVVVSADGFFVLIVLIQVAIVFFVYM